MDMMFTEKRPLLHLAGRAAARTAAAAADSAMALLLVFQHGLRSEEGRWGAGL